jgi:hypothetical protein
MEKHFSAGSLCFPCPIFAILHAVCAAVWVISALMFRGARERLRQGSGLRTITRQTFHNRR